MLLTTDGLLARLREVRGALVLDDVSLATVRLRTLVDELVSGRLTLGERVAPPDPARDVSDVRPFDVAWRERPPIARHGERDVECPVCQASPGEPCGKRGTGALTIVHAERLARAAADTAIASGLEG